MSSIHASAVSVGGRALLILGPAGCGKSTLALDMMARGAGLVADDRVYLQREGDRLMAACPAALAGLIEARGVGILRADLTGPSPVALVCDLGRAEPDRLPPFRNTVLLGVAVPLVLGPMRPHLGDALRQMLLSGRAA